MSNQELGEQGETQATELLQSLGYHIIVRNLRSRFSEVDILCRDGDTVVMVEVKTRSSRYHDPLLAVTRTKLRRLQRSMRLLAARYPNQNIRLDVVTVYWEPDRPPTLTHYPNIL